MDAAHGTVENVKTIAHSSPDQISHAEDRIAALVARHCGTLQRDSNRILGALETLLRHPEHNKVDWPELLRMLHTFHGSSGSLGFHEVADAALTLESHLRQIRPAGAVTDNDKTNALARKLQEHAAAVTPSKSTLVK